MNRPEVEIFESAKSAQSADKNSFIVHFCKSWLNTYGYSSARLGEGRGWQTRTRLTRGFDCRHDHLRAVLTQRRPGEPISEVGHATFSSDAAALCRADFDAHPFDVTYSERPVPVLVRDAETKKPIPGAQVEFSHQLAQSSAVSDRTSGVTEGDGIARMSAVPRGSHRDSLYVKATANGYEGDSLLVSDDDIKKIEPCGLFESKKGRPARIKGALFGMPPLPLSIGCRFWATTASSRRRFNSATTCRAMPGRPYASSHTRST